MANSIPIDGLENAIADMLESYSDEITENIKTAVDTVAKEVMEEIKSHITFGQPTGLYVKSFRLKETQSGKYRKQKTWYVADPHYRLTHLLENGHAKRGGGRTKSYPHIQYGEDLARKRMSELAEEAIKNAGR